MNAIGYIRISTKDQSRYSLDYQANEVKQYCERNQLSLLEVFRDNGECSDTFDRPDWLALETFIKDHRNKVRFLIIFDHDRFSRNLPEALTKIAMLEKKFGIKVLATSEAIDTDTTDPTVFLHRAFKYLIANHELIHIRKRTRMGMRQAQESGRFVNLAPFGYVNKRDEAGKPIIVIDEVEANIVRKIYSDFLSGLTIMQIYREVKKIGFTPKGNSSIQRVLERSVYAGFITVRLPDGKTKQVRGIHLPIISEYQFWSAQKLLDNKNPNKSIPAETMPLRGILKCQCGANLTGGKSKGKQKYYLYYRCFKHNKANLSAIRLHDQMDQILDLLSFTKPQVDFILESIQKKMEQALENRNKQLHSKKKALIDVLKKLEKLEERMINGEIEHSTYKKWFPKLSADKSEIQEEIKTLETDQNDKWATLVQLFPHLMNMKTMYHKADLRQKHLFLKAVFKGTLTYSEGKFRTPSINSIFAHNYMIIRKKELLLVEQLEGNLNETPMCTPDGTDIESFPH